MTEGLRLMKNNEWNQLARLFCKALEFALSLDLDPQRLRNELGMKGMKHFTEFASLLHLATDSRLANLTHPAARRLRLLVRNGTQRAVKTTQKSGFHSLRDFDATSPRFRQDSMSYLRASWLLEQLAPSQGQATFKENIHRIKDDVIKHLSSRGPDQRLRFAHLMLEMGLIDVAEYRKLSQEAFPHSTMVLKRPIIWFLKYPDRPYDITHEVFALTANGKRSLAKGLADAGGERFGKAKDFFDYTWKTLSKLIATYMSAKEVRWDIVCELLECLTELGGRPRHSKLIRRVRELVVEQAANPDGSFGDYARMEDIMRAQRGPKYDVRIGGNLHTTLVCLEALLHSTSHSPSVTFVRAPKSDGDRLTTTVTSTAPKSDAQ